MLNRLITYKYPSDIISTIQILYKSSCFKTFKDGNPISISRGVIQGGVLSPKLFNLFIDPLAVELNKLYLTFYFADDLSLLAKGKS